MTLPVKIYIFQDFFQYTTCNSELMKIDLKKKCLIKTYSYFARILGENTY